MVFRVEKIVTDGLRATFPYDARHDSLEVDQILDRIHVDYVASRVTENPHDATYFKLRYHPPHNEMWVYYLQVASSFRCRGLGRCLVQAIECVALQLGVQTINVLPLPHSVSFWEKMGYGQHPHLSRVLTKTLTQLSAKTFRTFLREFSTP